MATREPDPEFTDAVQAAGRELAGVLSGAAENRRQIAVLVARARHEGGVTGVLAASLAEVLELARGWAITGVSAPAATMTYLEANKLLLDAVERGLRS
jgi:hypothetical protein